MLASARKPPATVTQKPAIPCGSIVKAMDAIERDFEPLQGQLPKDYDKFENDLLEDLLRVFDSETLRTAKAVSSTT